MSAVHERMTGAPMTACGLTLSGRVTVAEAGEQVTCPRCAAIARGRELAEAQALTPTAVLAHLEFVAVEAAATTDMTDMPSIERAAEATARSLLEHLWALRDPSEQHIPASVVAALIAAVQG